MAHSFFDLSGKVAIVTGAGQGLGEAIARALAAHRARVALFDMNRATMSAVAADIAGTGHEAEAYLCDVQDDTVVKKSVASVLERFGRLDVLVNSAGIHRRHTPFDFPRADIDAVLNVN